MPYPFFGSAVKQPAWRQNNIGGVIELIIKGLRVNLTGIISYSEQSLKCKHKYGDHKGRCCFKLCKTIKNSELEACDAGALIIRLGFGGGPYDNYSIIYPPNPILIIKAPTLRLRTCLW